MNTIAGTISAGTKVFQVQSRDPVTGQRMPLTGTLYAAAGSNLDFEVDLGLGTWVKIADLTADAILNIPLTSAYSGERFQFEGSGAFIINTPLQLEELN